MQYGVIMRAYTLWHLPERMAKGPFQFHYWFVKSKTAPEFQKLAARRFLIPVLTHSLPKKLKVPDRTALLWPTYFLLISGVSLSNS